jgi:DNA-directed RNA polymerase alpha subunit
MMRKIIQIKGSVHTTVLCDDGSLWYFDNEWIKYPGMPQLNVKSVNMVLVEDLELMIRTTNILKSHGINTVQDLINTNRKHLSGLPFFGKKCLNDVVDRLHYLGLELDAA